MKILLPNLNSIYFRSLELTGKKFGGSGTTPFYSSALMNLTIFGHFSQYSQGIDLTKTLVFMLKVLRRSNNLMQRMTSITPFIYKIDHLEVFSKNFEQIF